jgi:uncharacterized surface protein with fasciclin (FAS1) repeats
MNYFIQRVLPIFAALVLLAGCKKKFDDYYERPASLEPPIYKQLEAKGNFTQFLALIDKAGYKQTLGSAGYWTIFAPTDSAFSNDAQYTAFLQSRGITSASAIDSTTAQMIVQYLLVFNGFEKDRIDDYQSSLGWVANSSFKRRTAYYTGFYDDTTAAGVALKAVASNRNNNGGVSYYNSADNNNKYIPIFTTDYFATRGLSASDYTFFYPNTPFTGFNVANAKVTQQNIAAENGVIHVIDHVITPLFSLDQYLRTNSDYSEFRNIMNKYLVQFLQNADASHRYQVLTGNASDVYVKVYSNLLAFSPNNENYLKTQDNDGQREGWTMFVPRNDSLLSYLDRILKEGYLNVNSLPLPVISDLVNAHMWQTTVWPSKFTSTFNFLGEPAYMNPTTNILDKKMLSNGVFYGTNKVNEPNVFSTVYGKSYLNPKMSLMTKLLDYEQKVIVTNPNNKFTLFMMPDAVLSAQNYAFNTATNLFTLNNVGNDSNRLNLLRILNTGVVETPNNEMANIFNPNDSGTIVSYGGEYLKWKWNSALGKPQIFTAGTRDRGLTVVVDSVKATKNGQVLYLNNLLYFTYIPIGKHIENLGTATTSEYNLFWNYLKNSTAYDATTSNIVGTSAGSFYTVFVPNNNAIRAAITAGLLPGTSAVPNFAPTLTSDRVLVEKFIQYHILDKKSVINDGKDIGSYATLLKTPTGEAVTIAITYPGNVFELTDGYNRKARMVTSQSNQLSNRTMIHLIDNYLKY